MAEYTGRTTFKGAPMTLVGNEVRVGDSAPDFAVNANLMEQARLSSARGRVVVVTSAPSVDTGICAMQLRAFNERATSLGEGVEVWYITRDLPFALSRFCGAEGIRNVRTFSDFRDRDFGEKFGVHIRELGLLARATWVIDRDGRVTYAEIVPEIAQEPNYDAAIDAVKDALVS